MLLIMKKAKVLFISLSLLIVTITGGCVQVKAFQKNKLNDSEMELNARRSEKSENNFQSYREGASGANGGKVGGGCGCN